MARSQWKGLPRPPTTRAPIFSSPADFSSHPSRTCVLSPMRIAPPRNWRRTWSWSTAPSPISTTWSAPGRTSSTRSRPTRTSEPKASVTLPPRSSAIGITSRRGRPAHRIPEPSTKLTRTPWRWSRRRSPNSHQATRMRRISASTRRSYASGRLDRRLDPPGERVGVLARGAQRGTDDQLAEPAALEDVEHRQLRAAVDGREVVAALGHDHDVLGALGPADLRRRLERRDLELPLRLHPGVLDRAPVDGPDAGGPVGRLGDLLDPGAELRVVGAVGEEGEDLLDRPVDPHGPVEAPAGHVSPPPPRAGSGPRHRRAPGSRGRRGSGCPRRRRTR